MKFTKLFLTALLGAAFFASCNNDESGPIRYVPQGDYDSGVLVLSQGGFGHGDASLSYISSDFTRFEDDIFSTVNAPAILGDTAQDIGFYNEFAYIILNGSNKIEIVNRFTMVHIASITTGLNNPRFIAFASGKGYVTNWGDGSSTTDDYVAVINLANNTISATIPVAEGPERIVENAGKLYVAHTGGFGYGNTISVINEATNAVTSISVGDVPNAMQIDGSNLWVCCGGKPSFSGVETVGGIMKINLSNNQITTALAYTDVTKHPSNLVLSGTDLFYTMGNGIFKMAQTAADLPIDAAFTTAAQGVGEIYSFAIQRNQIYVGDAGNYVDDGHVYVYSLGNVINPLPIGTLEHSYTVGVIPTGFYFNLQ